MTSTNGKSSPDSKAAWKRRNDDGPHTATFPSGARLSFRIPDSSSLLRAGALPEALRTTAILCAGHPDGAEGYMAELVTTAIISAERGDAVTRAIEDGIQLAHFLVAEMLVSPKVTPEEVEAGDFPEMDIRMLLEFAERRRNIDAAGNRMPITVLREYASFRDESEGLEGVGDGGTGGSADGDPVPDVDGAPV